MECFSRQDVSRGSVCHNATIIANGLMHYGTTSDTLLRENLEWLKKASNWAKFTATASLGLVHWVGAARPIVRESLMRENK